MNDPSSNQILYPGFALFSLTVVVLMRMRAMRFAAVRSGKVSIDYYRAFRDGDEPEELRVVSRHFVNLFEMPVLFYVVIIMIHITESVSSWLITLAWLYVALRYLHSYIHLGSNDVRKRVTVYLASAFVLLVMWASLFLRLVLGGS
jgi:hypothetical protein